MGKHIKIQKTQTLEDLKKAIEAFSLQEVIDYLETTKEESWCTDVVRTKDGRNCVMGHIFDFGGGDNGGGQFWDLFEDLVCTTYMIYPVNDGKHPKYQQPTPKQRCITYLKDIRDGKEMNTHQSMDWCANN